MYTGGKPELYDAFRHLLSISSKWKNIGALLAIPSDTLDGIEHDEPDVDSRLREMLTRWIKQVNPSPTCSWTQLIDAVKLLDPSKAEELNCFKDLPNCS